MLWLMLFSVGITSGIFAGLLGVGGGLIFLPLAKLYYIDHLGYPPEFLRVLIATSTAIIVSNGLSATIVHYRKHNIDMSMLPWFVAACLLGSRLGVLMVDKLPIPILRCILAGFLIILAVRIFRGRDSKSEDQPLNQKKRMQIGGIGVGISTLSSMLGLGGGALMTPVLNIFYKQPIKRAIGTASLFTFTVASTACIYYLLEPTLPSVNHSLMVGHVDLQIAALVSGGGILGSWAGARLLHHSPVETIQKIFAVLLFLGALKMML
ncbi:MAG: sulfite exporter TauE/SafE family protein [Deltaproteobacteria bacterium]|nr:sulfite exporter TauE/SafE family protein [Deltaproteobacteria bacterium]